MIENNETEHLTKIDSSYGVITHDKDCHIVTTELEITPTRSRQKGEKVFNEFSPHPAVAQYGIWEISKVTVGEEVNLKEHIIYFQNLLENKFEVIQKLRNKYEFEFVFYVLVTTEYGQAGFDLDEKELTFINKISNRFTYSCVTVEKI
jgi:hypothetical protein